ncbi:hypothetical protein M5689_006719 [Euphorbia peplus]|nr:hypothetical protein M5689_006719 [Euphorbia peplus]
MNWIDVRNNGQGKLVAIKVGMHGCGSESTLLVNAEIDSMGGVVDGGVGDYENDLWSFTKSKAECLEKSENARRSL